MRALDTELCFFRRFNGEPVVYDRTYSKGDSVVQTAKPAVQISLRRPDAYLCSRLAISV